MKTLKATSLGGVGRFGRNALLLEILDDGASQGAILIDCGVRFLGHEGFGFDVGLPDFSPIEALDDKLLAVVVTHGHEDHIGALPYLAQTSAAPIFCTPFTEKLIERRFKRLGQPLSDVTTVELGDRHQIGPFRVRWRAVSHSIPDASCLVIDTPVGRLVHSGDFRIDPAPLLGQSTDLDGLTEDGDDGVALLFADSTGAGSLGDNPGEASVIEPFVRAMEQAPGRVFVATFGSQLSRLYAVAEACRRTGRKLALRGRSLEDTVAFARRLGHSGLDDVLIHRSEVWGHHPANLVIACTGAQGETNAALARLARGDDGRTPLSAGDVVLFSARVIPGNELVVADVVDKLSARGVDVVFDRALHVSGHGHAGDLETLIAATRPQTFVAVHGNVHHLVRHRTLFERAGLDADAVVAMTDGHALILDETGAVTHVADGVRREPFALDAHIEMKPRPILEARKQMSTGGVVLALVDKANARITLHCEAVINPPNDDVLASITRRAANAFLLGANLDEVGDDETLDDALRRFLSARFADAGAGSPHVVIVDPLSIMSAERA